MGIWRRILDQLRGRRVQQDADLDRELRTHLDLEAEEKQEAGMSSEEASYAAHRAFGNTTLVTEDVRELWRWTWLERLIQDSRFGLGDIPKRPGLRARPLL